MQVGQQIGALFSQKGAFWPPTCFLLVRLLMLLLGVGRQVEKTRRDSRKKPREKTCSLWEQRRRSTSAAFLHQVPLDALIDRLHFGAMHATHLLASLHPPVGTLEHQLRLIGVVYCALSGAGGCRCVLEQRAYCGSWLVVTVIRLVLAQP
ncbi:hypothetical protein DFH09DRAFT_1285903 [Mycena vulgaris]|nr:hypothetical protein DFH09DRAFT_1285903 [Mycena vulgaris]